MVTDQNAYGCPGSIRPRKLRPGPSSECRARPGQDHVASPDWWSAKRQLRACLVRQWAACGDRQHVPQRLAVRHVVPDL